MSEDVQSCILLPRYEISSDLIVLGSEPLAINAADCGGLALTGVPSLPFSPFSPSLFHFSKGAVQVLSVSHHLAWYFGTGVHVLCLPPIPQQVPRITTIWHCPWCIASCRRWDTVPHIVSAAGMQSGVMTCCLFTFFYEIQMHNTGFLNMYRLG